jgi:Holliday junction DNA helicase RuvA
MIAETVRRHLQLLVGQEVSLHILEYLEGNQTGNRFIPRKLGFLTEQQLEFFELFCTVEKIGVKKALKAMSRSVRDIADAINRHDVKWLTTLPGIGAATAEQIVTGLKRKIAPFLHGPVEPDTAPNTEAVAPAVPPRKGKTTAVAVSSDKPVSVDVETAPLKIIDDLYLALQGLGMNPMEARDRVDGLLRSGKAIPDVSTAMNLIFARSAS